MKHHHHHHDDDHDHDDDDHDDDDDDDDDASVTSIVFSAMTTFTYRQLFSPIEEDINFLVII